MYSSNPIANLLIWIGTGFGYFGERYKSSRNMLTHNQNQIVESVAEKERLKVQIEQARIELVNQKQNQTLELTREKVQWQMKLDNELNQFKIQKESELAKIRQEKEQALSKQQFDLDQAVKRVELKSDELLMMKKLEFEQKIKQAELDRDRSILIIKEEYAKKETTLHQDLNANMYGKLSESLVKMSQEGDKNTKFVHELMMKIFDKAPGLNSFQLTQRQYQGESLPAPQAPIEVEQVK